MDEDHINDISIGKDKWIYWVDFDQSNASLDIDTFLESTLLFWRLLETECVSGCCGINAFSFWSEDIQNAQLQLNDKDIKQKFETLRTDLSKKSDATFISSFLNNLFDKKVFLQLLDHLIYQLK